MKVLVVGSGGREHALCWKIAQSETVDKLYAVPGNGGISQIAECVDINTDDIPSILAFAREKTIDLTVVGPEAPLVAGIVDNFKKHGLRIFGPDKYIAQLEGSKVFAKETMARLGIPTADFKILDNPVEAKDYVRQKKPPIVVKADGLAAGKGVIVCQTEDEALSAIDTIMVDKKFGSSGDRVVIEDCLVGEEASVILVTDGKDFVSLASSQDHKRIFDNDQGPNTGGMGAYSPAPVVTQEVEQRIEDEIIIPLINGLAKDGTPYKGVLYLGLMITEARPYVLEFNVRFGDPENQAILPRLNTDLVDIIEASIDERIKDIELEWNPDACICVVCASGGYPGSYKKGIPIYGLEEAARLKDVVIFHAGTKLTSDKKRATRYVTNGGRVLGVTALGEDIRTAIDTAYAACSKIYFEGIHYRKDIGHRAIKTQNSKLKTKKGQKMKRKQIAVIIGSKSDLSVVQHGLDILEKFGVPYELKILSAHRTPSETIRFAREAKDKGYKIIIAAAGGAAHLAGVIAAHTTIPVIGVPIETKALGGVDSLFSTVQMPSGVPVACMAIGKSGAINASLFAIEILAIRDKRLQRKLLSYKKSLALQVLKR